MTTAYNAPAGNAEDRRHSDIPPSGTGRLSQPPRLDPVHLPPLAFFFSLINLLSRTAQTGAVSLSSCKTRD